MELGDFQIFKIITIEQLFLVAYSLGLTLGAGAAFMSDFMFVHVLKDSVISKSEFGFLTLASRVVWLGVAILLVSDMALFLLNPDELVNTPTFLAKVTVVAVLTINGYIFHRKHIPLIKRFIGKSVAHDKKFYKELKLLFISGAISGVSWVSALVLGVIDSTPYSYFQIMGAYVLILILGSIVSQFSIKYHFPEANKY